MELEYRGRFEGITAELTASASGTNQKKTLHSSTEWQLLRFQSADLKGPLSLELKSSEKLGADDWLEFRNRADLYQANGIFLQAHTFLQSLPPVATFALSLFAAMGLTILLIVFSSQAISSYVVYVVFLLLSLLLHFRLQSYFYFDTWHVLERFRELGPRGVIYSHNEHFLPLFFALFYSEAILFKGSYELFLLVSHLLHALNALLVFLILKRVLAHKNAHSTFLSLGLSALFLVNANHAEALHWAFIQSVISAHTCIFFGLYSALKYLDSRGSIDFYLSMISLGLSPFFFANAFISPGLLILILAAMYVSGRQLDLSNVKALVYGSMTVIAITALCYICYDRMTEAQEVNVHAGLQAANIIRYVVSGVLIGTCLRGIGLFPSLDLEGVRDVSASLPRALEEYARTFSSLEAFYWLLSALVLLVICLIICGLPTEDRKKYFSLALIGLLWCTVYFILPAIGRAQFGPGQALAPRYHYGSLFGLLLILSGAFAFLSQKRALLPIVLAILFSLHLFLAGQYTRYTSIGLQNRDYIAKLKDWRKTIEEPAPNQDFRFDAKGSVHQGQQPRWVNSLTTGVNSEIIYDILRWLED